jgi:hypothetical protein
VRKYILLEKNEIGYFSITANIGELRPRRATQFFFIPPPNMHACAVYRVFYSLHTHASPSAMNITVSDGLIKIKSVLSSDGFFFFLILHLLTGIICNLSD